MAGYLAEYGDGTLFALILQLSNMPIDQPGVRRLTPLERAAKRGRKEIVKLLLAIGNVNIYLGYPLYMAVVGRQLEVVELLFALDMSSYFNETRLVEVRDSPVKRAICNEDGHIFELLLQTGKVGRYDLAQHGGALGFAVYPGSIQIIRLILNSLEEERHLAIRNPAHRSQEVEPLLKTCQFDVNAKDHEGRTLLSQTVCLGEMDIVALLLVCPEFDVNTTYNIGRTPLSLAALQAAVTFIRQICETNRVDINMPHILGKTALRNAASIGSISTVESLLEWDSIDVNLRDSIYGQTPLWVAAKKGYTTIVCLLLATGKVNMQSEDRIRERMLQLAHPECRRVIKRFMDGGRIDKKYLPLKGDDEEACIAMRD